MTSLPLPAHAIHLFHYLFQQVALGIAVEDLDGKILLANPALCSMLGYADHELCGMNCSEFSDPQDAEDDWALFQQLRAGAIDNYSLEKHYLRKDGTNLWGRLNVSLLRNSGEESSPVVFAFLEDITERKLAEASSRESEQRLRLAVQAGRMYAFDWDVVSDVITRSRESLDILNWRDAEHDTGREFHARIHPDDRELYEAAEASLTPENPTYKIGFRTSRADGTVTWLEDTGRASFDTQGKMVKVIGMVTDITERKRAEEELREREDQLRLLLDSTAGAIYGIDLQQRCTFCNPACLSILGYRHIDEVLGKNMHDLIHHTRADGRPYP